MLTLVFNITIFIIGATILVRAASLLVHAVTVVGHYFHISEFRTSFIIIGVITSIPEIAVSVSASIQNVSQIALGNALGSNLTDLTLIIAIPALISRGINVRSLVARKDAIIMGIYTFIPIFMIIDGMITRIDGIILLIFYGLYLYRLSTQRSYSPSTHTEVTRHLFIRQVVVIISTGIALAVASELIVYASHEIALILNLPAIIIGLILVSVGTSLPELTHGLKAVALHREQQLVGNIVGSVVANATLVIGIAALIRPIVIGNLPELTMTTILLLIVVGIFTLGVYNDHKIGVKEVLVLLALYFVFIISGMGLQIVQQAMP